MTTILGVVPLGVGAVVLLGWYLDASALVRLSPALPAMQSATALAFLFAGLSVLAADRGHAGAAAVLAGVVTVIGAVAVAGRFLGVAVAPGALPPGADLAATVRSLPMAPKSGLAFLLAGLAIVLLTRPRSRSPVPPLLALVAALGVLLLAGEDLAKYAAEATGITGRTLKQMALHTVVAFLALAGAILEVARCRLVEREAPGVRVAVLAASAVLLLSALTAHGIRTGQVASIRTMARIAGQEAAIRLDAALDARRQAIGALTERLGGADEDSAEWTAFATALTDHVAGIGRIVWVDATGAARWSAPPGEAMPAEPSIAVPVADVRAGGTVIGGLDMADLLAAAGPGTDAFSIELVAGGVRFVRDAGSEGTDPVFLERIVVDLPGGAGGIMLVRPTRELLSDTRRPVPLAVLGIGTVLAAMLAVIIQLGGMARHRAAHLETALGRLEGAVRERRRAESALARSEERLRESRKMEAVARLAGGVAHHFNNLLSVVRGYADLLLDSNGDGTLQREYLDEIRTAAARGGDLTRNLLTISARHVLHPRTIELRTLVYGQSRALGRMLGDAIQLHIRAETADTRVHIDPGPFTNALGTLAANARDAMPAGGALVLTLRERALMPADASAHDVRPGAFVELEVADTGAGMDATRRETLFEPFAGEDRPGHRGGFGLAMLYGFVRQSGGAIEVETRPGNGSAFRLLLPRADGRVAVRPGARPVHAVGSAPIILLAEDEDAVRRLAARLLERAGFEIIVAADGEDALALVRGREHELDLVVTDVVMPGVDGAELARRLWAARPGLPILFISGYAAADIPATADARTLFLQKPFEATALIDSVQALLTAETATVDGR